MEIVQDRTLKEGQQVQVYYNLHRGGFSIRDKKTGLVVAYANTVMLSNAIFKVSEKGRQHVIEEKRKRVHAFVEGKFGWADRHEDLTGWDTVYYNPYTTRLFTIPKTGEYVLSADEVIFKDKVCFVK